MATEFIMPRLPDQPQFRHSHQQQQHHHFYAPQPQPQSPIPQGGSQQISPSSASDNPSPTTASSSPVAHHHNQRLRPLYMPAVLRPNLYPSRKAPAKRVDDDDGRSLQSNNSLLKLSAWGGLGRITRRSTGDSGKGLNDDDDEDDQEREPEWNQWKLDLFPKPTSQPSRGHWKADLDSTMCDEPSCMRRFNYWTRRHHCRKCGNIFCDLHSSHGIPLDQDANYNPKGTPSRACSHCYSAFREWRSRTNSQASSDDSSSHAARTAPTSPCVSTPIAKDAQKHPAEVAMSVPRDWNWSTF